MVETSISAGANTQQPIALPEAIKFKVPIYLNTEEVIFDITIKLAHDEVDVYIVTDAPELELRKFEVFEKILEPIKAMEGVLVSYGTPATENWNYNTGRA